MISFYFILLVNTWAYVKFNESPLCKNQTTQKQLASILSSWVMCTMLYFPVCPVYYFFFLECILLNQRCLLKDASRKDRSVTAGIFEKRAKKILVIVKPHSWLLSGFKWFVFCKFKARFQREHWAKMGPWGREKRGSLGELLSFVQGL